MKKIKFIILPFVFLLLLSWVLAASVSRTMPARVEPNSEVQVTLTLNGAKTGEAVAIEDTIPNTISINSWEISGSKEAKSEVNYATKPSQKAGLNRNSWSFTAATGAPSITYKFNAPSAAGNLEFDVRWITSEGFSHQTSALTVRTITCGDSVCEGSENSDNCVQDCPKPAPPSPPPPAPTPLPTVKPSGLSNITIGWIVVAIIVIGAAIGYFMWQKKKEKY